METTKSLLGILLRGSILEIGLRICYELCSAALCIFDKINLVESFCIVEFGSPTSCCADISFMSCKLQHFCSSIMAMRLWSSCYVDC